MEVLHDVSLENESAIALSLDWDNRLVDTSNPAIVVSQSDGYLSYWKLAESQLEQINSWKAHDCEVEERWETHSERLGERLGERHTEER